MAIRPRTAIIIVSGLVVLSVILAAIYLYAQYTSFQAVHYRPGCVSYDKPTRVISISCESTLTDIDYALKNQNILKKEPDGMWLLNSSLIVSNDATLVLSSPEARWLKISSQGRLMIVGQILSRDQDMIEPYSIQVKGSLKADGVKLTSWDSEKSSYSQQSQSGAVPRPYIVFQEGANASRIANSEIAYLGYNSSRKQGLSFYGGDRSILTGNKIHDLWYGFFSTNVGHIVINNNLVNNNFKYGIDPHLLSHDMVIKNNHISNSRIGLICSLNCSNLTLEKNIIENNKQAGLMLSRNTVNSTARFNNISQSEFGISVSESHLNAVYGNIISNNVEGLTIKNNSSRNIFSNNTIDDSQDCGVVVSERAQNNTIKYNSIHNFGGAGICLAKSANRNSFYSNEIDGVGNFGINVKDHSIANRFQDNIIHLTNNAIRVYNNTGTLFVNNKIGNTYGHQYIISGNSVLNLSKTQFLGDRIRIAGDDTNTIWIRDSGTISVNTQSANNRTHTSAYNTDTRPYVANLTSSTVKLYSEGINPS